MNQRVIDRTENRLIKGKRVREFLNKMADQ